MPKTKDASDAMEGSKKKRRVESEVDLTGVPRGMAVDAEFATLDENSITKLEAAIKEYKDTQAKAGKLNVRAPAEADLKRLLEWDDEKTSDAVAYIKKRASESAETKKQTKLDNYLEQAEAIGYEKNTTIKEPDLRKPNATAWHANNANDAHQTILTNSEVARMINFHPMTEDALSYRADEYAERIKLAHVKMRAGVTREMITSLDSVYKNLIKDSTREALQSRTAQRITPSAVTKTLRDVVPFMQYSSTLMTPGMTKFCRDEGPPQRTEKADDGKTRLYNTAAELQSAKAAYEARVPAAERGIGLAKLYGMAPETKIYKKETAKLKETQEQCIKAYKEEQIAYEEDQAMKQRKKEEKKAFAEQKKAEKAAKATAAA